MRLLTIINLKLSVTLDVKKAETKQEFIIPLTLEREAEIQEWRWKLKDAISRTIYYVLSRYFYTFRG